MRSLAFIAALSAVAVGSPTTARAPSSATYVNPVIDADFPDPTVIRAGDGLYYAYGTQTKRDGKWINIQLARSPDLVHWTYLGDALPTKPGWASSMQDFWAPHVQRAGTRYVMYLSVKPNGSNERYGMCLGVATSTSPAGPFKPIARPLKCGPGFEAIDPMAYDDPATGKHLLYWGSGFQPITVQALAPDRLAFARGSKPKPLVWPSRDRKTFPVLIEGAWLTRHAGFYYLFYSGDNCCGEHANYTVMVARSRHATGPFETKSDPVILAKRGKWFAPGHNSVVTDPAGQDWIVYHAVDIHHPRTLPADEVNTRRIMLIDRIRWVDGWPRIDGPSEQPQPAPAR